jgi:hypothetical protein
MTSEKGSTGLRTRVQGQVWAPPPPSNQSSSSLSEKPSLLGMSVIQFAARGFQIGGTSTVCH